MRTALAFMALAQFLLAQAPSFNSGSNGSDGALNLTTPGTILFDPRDAATFGRVLDADGDGVYHFTTITIGAGVTVQFTAQKYPDPVYWLAQGVIQIDGTLDLNGSNGVVPGSLIANRAPTVPGSGGYSGGISAYYPPDGSPRLEAQAGSGPGGGEAERRQDCNVFGTPPGNGRFTGNQFLVPLIGGSGGGGGLAGSGGAGGGAILLASSSSVIVNGAVLANGGRVATGGNICQGGGGSGGAIRIAANAFSGNGILGVLTAGSRWFVPANHGRIRIEAYQTTFTGNINFNIPGFPNGPNTASYGTPFNTFVPTSKAGVRLRSIGGISVPEQPNGSFVLPDVMITATSAVQVVVDGNNIPVGTVVTLLLYSDNGPDQTIALPPLTGTLASSTAQANVTFPSGFSRGFVRAQWTQ